MRNLVLASALFAGVATVCAEEIKGHLVFGHEAYTLQPCGDSRIFWIQVPDSTLRQRLKAEYSQLLRRPYEAVYAEFEGEHIDHSTAGFAVDYDGTIEVHALREMSRDGGEACAAVEPVATESAEVEPAATYVFVCDEQRTFTVRSMETKAWLFHPQGTLQLPAVSSEIGERYSNGVVELWIDGQRAQLREPNGELLQCRNDRQRAIWEKAKLDGADFRAVGNEPGWNLQIFEQSRLLLVSDYGATRVERPLPEPSIDRATRKTRWDAGDLVVEVTGSPCRDSMSGESFETTVMVTWGKQTLRGCGRALH